MLYAIRTIFHTSVSFFLCATRNHSLLLCVSLSFSSTLRTIMVIIHMSMFLRAKHAHFILIMTIFYASLSMPGVSMFLPATCNHRHLVNVSLSILLWAIMTIFCVSIHFSIVRSLCDINGTHKFSQNILHCA